MKHFARLDEVLISRVSVFLTTIEQLAFTEALFFIVTPYFFSKNGTSKKSEKNNYDKMSKRKFLSMYSTDSKIKWHVVEL